MTALLVICGTLAVLAVLHLLIAHRRRRSIANSAAVIAARARLRRERRRRELLGVAPRRDVWRAP